LNPNFVVPAKTQFKDLFDAHYEAQKEKIQEKLDSFDIISITTDMWSAKYQKKSYGGFTAHSIDMNLKPTSLKLGIFELADAHTADNIEKFIKAKLVSLSIWDRVLFFAVDNASVMRKCMNNMKKDFVGCFNHLLHLIVNRFLDIKIVKKAINDLNLNLSSDVDDDSDSDKDENDDDEDDDLYSDEVDDLFQGLSDEFYESKEYSDEEVECLKSIKLVIKKIKKIVSASESVKFSESSTDCYPKSFSRSSFFKRKLHQSFDSRCQDKMEQYLCIA